MKLIHCINFNKIIILGSPSFRKEQHNGPKNKKRIIDEGSEINVKENCRWSALMFASMNGYLEIAKLLIDEGAKSKC